MGTLKIVGPRGVYGFRFYQLQGPLALGGVRVLPSTKGSVSRIVEGKSRAKALLNPAVYRIRYFEEEKKLLIKASLDSLGTG